MRRHELKRLLENGNTRDILGIFCGVNASGKRDYIVVCFCQPDPPNLYPPSALSEMPDYVARQKVIAQKPYGVVFPKPGGSIDNQWEGVDFTNLDEVGICLEGLGHSLDEVERLTDFWESD